jgi:uncharacterized iron-regulated membrane protein
VRGMRGGRADGWYSVHRWLGIGLGVWFALVGLTGSILVFEEPIDRWLNPQLLSNRTPGAFAPPEAIVAAAWERELGHVERIRVPAAQHEVYRLLIRTRPQRRVAVDRIEATFDPVTAELLGSREAERIGLSAPYLLKAIYEFHRNVLLGEPGSNIVGIAGFLLLGSALTGLVVALPRRRDAWKRLVWVNLKASATRVFFDVHRSIGALFAVLLLLATITGSTLVYVNYVRDLVSVFSKVAPFPTIPWRPGPHDENEPLSVLLARVHAAYPEHAVTEIRVPHGQLTGYQFYLRQPRDQYRLGDTIVWVHPVSGEILIERSNRTRNSGETLMHWLFPLHSGTAFGTPGMIAMCLTGVTPILLVFTGLWVWLRKRRGEQIGRRKRAQALSPVQPSRAAAARRMS